MISDLDTMLFRSTTERFWAALITETGYSFLYESQTFDTALGRYCPDFYIKELDLIIEVKGRAPTNVEREKLRAVEQQTQSLCMFLCGIPDVDVSGITGGAFCTSREGPTIPFSWLWEIDKRASLINSIHKAKRHIHSTCLINRYFAAGFLSSRYDFLTPGEQALVEGNTIQEPWLEHASRLIKPIQAMSN
ncbi:hypothetical protein [Enterovibrio norvegicus]|uniref:hypothetical protein n=1 Tax=Enterovibrio norvegicus TaxID=188144 RepID=UPI0024B27EAA|nr:hypothetical protein [Enterovibrio norvegicus]